MRVLIVGSGVVGASIAWHLAARGVRDVLVIDRAPGLGGGSTARATGGFRVQFGTQANIRLSVLSREKLLRFEDEVGADSGYRPHGYLFLARSDSAIATLREANALQHSLGVTEPEIISSADARKLNPAIADDTILGAAYGPRDGFIRPTAMLHAYHDAAVRLGVRFQFGVAFDARPEADVIVNATGAWAGTLGIDVPVRPLRRQVACTVETDALPESMPMTIWADDGFHLRVRDRRILLLRPDDVASSFDTSVDDAWIADVVGRARERIPVAASIPLDRAQCWGGLYEMSPDRHVILGFHPELPHVFLANGSSGHGVMHAPAIGQLAAELITGANPSIDVHALRPSRFAEGDAIHGPDLL